VVKIGFGVVRLYQTAFATTTKKPPHYRTFEKSIDKFPAIQYHRIKFGPPTKTDCRR
jgi:hypothetical protein